LKNNQNNQRKSMSANGELQVNQPCHTDDSMSLLAEFEVASSEVSPSNLPSMWRFFEAAEALNNALMVKKYGKAKGV